MSNDEVIGRHGEGQHEACQEARPQFRQDDAAESHERRRSQVTGRIIAAAVQGQELGHDAQDDIGQVEDDVGHEDGTIPQAQAHAQKEEHQGNPRDDVRIEQTHTGHAEEDRARFAAHAAQGHAGDEAQDGGNGR